MALSIAFLLALACTAGALAAVKPSSSPLGRTVEAFELKDFAGKPYRLADFADRKAVVVVYLGTECEPLQA